MWRVQRKPQQLPESQMFCEVSGRDTRALTFGWRLWVILQVSSLEDGSGLWKILGGDRIPNEDAATGSQVGERWLGEEGHMATEKAPWTGQGGSWDVE